MSKYCCDKFKNRAELQREEGLNIRIIKFNKNELLDKVKPFRFFITLGYKTTDRNVPTLNIAHCPFCGQDLFNFYSLDEYINETDTDFLYP
jgi:hypothetical protein